MDTDVFPVKGAMALTAFVVALAATGAHSIGAAIVFAAIVADDAFERWLQASPAGAGAGP